MVTWARARLRVRVVARLGEEVEALGTAEGSGMGEVAAN